MSKEGYTRKIKCELYNDSMQSWKCYPIQKAQLIIADIPYNVGTNFYGSNPMWYIGGTTRTENLSLPGNRHLQVILILTFMNIFIFVRDL
jgi:site-specific DNA-methyltransferase (adenine-specific)